MPDPQPARPVRPRPRPKPAEPDPKPNGANGHAEAPRRLDQLPEFVAYRQANEEREVARKALEARWGNIYPATGEWIRQADVAVHVEPLGLGYTAAAHEAVRLELTRLRENRGELSAELSVTRWGHHLLQQRFNLSNGNARAATARLLATHPFGGEFSAGGVPDWREILEQLCLRVLEAERSGEDMLTVGPNPIATAPPRIVEPYLPEAVTLVWAPQGVGKSTLAAGVVVTLETYTEVIPEWHPTREVRCLVLDWEASPSEWNDRISRIAAAVAVEPPAVLYRRMRRPLADSVETVAALAAGHDVGYLIIDSVEKAAGARAEGSTYEEKAERLFMAVDRIGIPALMLDHVTGDELRHGASKVSAKSIGSVLKGAWARATYDLKRDPSSTEASVEMLLTNVKVNDARRERPYEFAIAYEGDEHTGPIRFVKSHLESPELRAALPQADQMWRILAEGAQTTKYLADALGTTPAAIRALYQRDQHRERPRFTRLPDGSLGLAAAESQEEPA